MPEFAMIGNKQILLFILGTILWIAAPIVLAVIWKIKTKEPVTTILLGAAAFFVFVTILEKPIQNILIFPTQMGLPDHAISRYINARPLLWVLLVSLFPGVFEETGRFIVFKTLLKKNQNRETSISYGIGHGGFEVMYLMGLTYVGNIVYSVMINTGAFGAVIDQVREQAPEQVDTLYLLADQLAAFSAADLAVAAVERIFAVLFHIGLSILVFYACKDKRKLSLYPLAILLHTIVDGIAALMMKEIIHLSVWQLEVIIGLAECLTFFGAYFLLYRKDDRRIQCQISTQSQTATGSPETTE